jgi:hypothetical protein
MTHIVVKINNYGQRPHLNIFLKVYINADNAYYFNIKNKLMYDRYNFNQYIPLKEVKFNGFIYHMKDMIDCLNIPVKWLFLFWVAGGIVGYLDLS